MKKAETEKAESKICGKSGKFFTKKIIPPFLEPKRQNFRSLGRKLKLAENF